MVLPRQGQLSKITQLFLFFVFFQLPTQGIVKNEAVDG